LTLGQFFLGIVTLVVATIVYRWQKQIDRETALQMERRQLYAEYASSAKKLFYEQPFGNVSYSEKELRKFHEISDAESDLYALHIAVQLISSDEVLNALNSFDSAFRNWRVAISEALQSDDSKKIRDTRAAYETILQQHRILVATMRAEVNRDQAPHVVQLVSKKLGQWRG
jgi:hypothetical protein